MSKNTVMTTAMPWVDRVPVRIQMWLPNGVTYDIRCWLDKFDLNREVGEFPTYPTAVRFEPTGHEDFMVKAHIDQLTERPWKFHRGKPVMP